MVKSYALRFTQAEWQAIERGLKSLPRIAGSVTTVALDKLRIANEVMSSIEDDNDGGGEGGNEGEANGNGHSNGNGNGGMEEQAKPLSRRELLILKGLTLGHSNKVIARNLVITESTVKVHMKAVLRKLRLVNRTQAAIWARENINLIGG